MLSKVKRYIKSDGFTLIEVMVSLIIVSLGLLALASFQGELFSTSNLSKARAEAASVAESKLEDFRSKYFDENIASFKSTDWYAAFSTETVEGTNADFTVDYALAGVVETTNADGDIVYEAKSPIVSGDKVTELVLNVTVSWDGASVPYVLQSRLSYLEDSTVADLLNTLAESGLVAPTGKARLGEGNLVEAETDQFSDPDGDGVMSYKRNLEETPDDKFGDVVLVNASGEILLTLDRACVTQSGNCTDFSVIKGRFYIDESQFPNSDSAFEVKDGGNTYPGIFLKASDAAYCSYYYGGVAPGPNFSDHTFIDDDAAVSGASAMDAMSDPYISDSGRADADTGYQYLSYSCYVGAGWYGNIGVLLKRGLTADDKLSMGDPTSTVASEQPQLALKRVYRGMVIKDDSCASSCSDYDVWDASGSSATTLSASTDAPVYGSIGIRDAIVIENQDMVFCSESNSGDCDDAMNRTDSVSGASSVFVGMPTDFVCLSSITNAVAVSDSSAVSVAYDVTANSLDNGYHALTNCPFDPSDPPSFKYRLKVDIDFSAADWATQGSDASNVISQLYTSDGLDFCSFDQYDSGPDELEYYCDFYIYDHNGNGVVDSPDENWTGYVAIIPADGVQCSPLKVDSLSYSGNDNLDVIDCSLGYSVTLEGTFDFDNGAKYSVSSVTMGAASCSFYEADGTPIAGYANDGDKFICISDDSDFVDSDSDTLVDDYQQDLSITFTATKTADAVAGSSHLCSSSSVISDKTPVGSDLNIGLADADYSDSIANLQVTSTGTSSGKITITVDKNSCP